MWTRSVKENDSFYTTVFWQLLCVVACVWQNKNHRGVKASSSLNSATEKHLCGIKLTVLTCYGEMNTETVTKSWLPSQRKVNLMFTKTTHRLQQCNSVSAETVVNLNTCCSCCFWNNNFSSAWCLDGTPLLNVAFSRLLFFKCYMFVMQRPYRDH